MVHRSILALRFGCRTLADPNSRKKDKVEFFESLFFKNPVSFQQAGQQTQLRIPSGA